MTELSTKPYLIRAIYEWCADCGFTPYLSIKVDQNTRVPMEYVKNGEIVLSISLQATRNLTVGNDLIQFSARFNGVSREIAVPVYAVQGVFARENGRGMFFEAESAPESASHTAPVAPTLQSVPTAANPVSDASPSNGDDPDNSPDKPKGPPRGNLRVIK
jgi:stringent starvation protein B